MEMVPGWGFKLMKTWPWRYPAKSYFSPSIISNFYFQRLNELKNLRTQKQNLKSRLFALSLQQKFLKDDFYYSDTSKIGSVNTFEM